MEKDCKTSALFDHASKALVLPNLTNSPSLDSVIARRSAR